MAVDRLAAQAHDWDRLVDSAGTHQLRPALAGVVADFTPRDAEDNDAKSRLLAEASAQRGRARLLAAELQAILEALGRAGVNAVPFKGPVLAAFAGPASFAREMNDLDLLLEERDLARAVEALGPMGYLPAIAPQAMASPWLARVACELPLSGSRVACPVELHWRLAPPWYPAPIRVDEVIASVAPRDFLGVPVPWPAPEELFLVLVADGMKSGGWGLRWVGDLAALLRGADLDWARVEAIARRNGGLGNVRVALALASGLASAAAGFLDRPDVALALPAPARALADGAVRSRRLARALRSILTRLATDAALDGALANFTWALTVADSPVRAAGAIARHLAGPSVADLEAMPRDGSRDGKLRARALARRIGWGAR